jgi:Ca2+-binding EF-hand superfamily protein
MGLFRAGFLGLLATTAALAAAGPAPARSERPALPEFAAMDRDGDGRVTREEMAAARTEGFAAADANRDGALDRTEIETLVRARLEATRPRRAERAARKVTDKFFERADTDRDGFVSAAEQTERLALRGFRVIDSDGDGTITRAEAEAPRRARDDRRRRVRATDAPAAPVAAPPADQ